MFSTGQILQNKYNILEHIGTGGGGIVYKAYQQGLGRTVAIKLIKADVADILNEHGEADILKNLKHSYVPSVYDFIHEDGNIYTVMEYVEGKSFKELLDNGTGFSQAQVLKYIRQLCEAVAYLHSRNPVVIHSDIKPANIMLTPEDNICLIDYNISLIINDSSNVIGVSDGYSPPEQYGTVKKAAAPVQSALNRNNNLDETRLDNISYKDETLMDNATRMDGLTRIEVASIELEVPVIDRADNAKLSQQSIASTGAYVDERSDIYSIGATAYHLITGKKPAVSTVGAEKLSHKSKNVSESFAAIINKSMEKDPSKRFESAEQMLRALNNLKKYDNRYKAMVFRQEAATVCVILGMALSCLTSVSGYIKMGEASLGEYNSYIEQMDNADYETAIAYGQTAIGLIPERAEAYEKTALLLYEAGRYESAIGHITDVINGKSLYVENGEAYVYDKLYYICGKCYLELGNYPSAVKAFERAIELNGNDSEYYCDYAVSLARCGNVSQSKAILKKAEEKGISNDSILLVKGEISYASQNYAESIESLNKCILLTDNDDVLYRAYVIGANAYMSAVGNNIVEESECIEFLDEAIVRLPIEQAMPFYEMLAQSYINAAQSYENTEYYYKAIQTYEKMKSIGWQSLSLGCSLVRLYRIIGAYDYALQLLEELLGDYGEDYTIYKLLAFVELDIQNEKNSSERDYGNFGGYYEKAKSFEKSTDFEMELLDEAYAQLIDSGML